VDFVTDRETLKKGIYAHLWNAEIRCRKDIPAGYLVRIGEDEGNRDLRAAWKPSRKKLYRY
jgi:hypothetical protein